MDTTAKNVVVIQDASKVLNLRIFYWIINRLSLKSEDMVTLVGILHEIYTPMGYKITVDDRTLVGVNQRFIVKELGKKKREYLDNEKLAQIAKLYESNKVAFKIKLFTGSSPKDVTLEVARNLKATWVILDRQMKKDEEFFLQNLSCGVSIVRCNNRIVRLRAPLDLPEVIQCNSHETYHESLPSVPYESLSEIDVIPQSTFKADEQNQIQIRRTEEEGCSNINEETCQISPCHTSADGTEKNNNQMIDKIDRDEKCQDQEQRDTTIVIQSDQTSDTNAQEIGSQQSQDDEEKTNNFHGEKCELSNPSRSEETIDQPKDDLLSQNQEQETSTMKSSMCISCTVCNTRRPYIGPQKEFAYEELEAATDCFSLKNCLSESGHLLTFKGQLEGGLKVVVKQHDITNTQVREKMKVEIQTILKARHKNVIMLLGSFIAERFLLTVYEHACNGSLDKYLSKESTRPLSWIERKRVAIGLARGLKYLHDNNIVHSNIKLSNILLTHDFNPLIGDFGLGKELEFKSYKNKNKGNYEYLAPEYQEKGKLSTKTDVYSFGVVILELISGRRTTNTMSEDKSLIEWAKPLLKGKKYSQLVDPIIRNSYEEDHLRWLVQAITKCLKKNPKDRLSMNMVVSSLQGIADSELCHRPENIPPVISDSRNVPDLNESQGPTTTKADQPSQEEEQIESRFYGEEKKLRLTIENNHFYMIDQRNSDKLSQIEEQMQNKPQGEERSSEDMIINDHEMDQTEADQMIDFEEQMPSTLYMEDITAEKTSINQMKGNQLSQDQEEDSSFVGTKIGSIPAPISGMMEQTNKDQLVEDNTQMQRICHEILLDRCQGAIILENSKSSACSVCKSRRPNVALPKEFSYDELLEATEGFSIENSLSESEDGPTFKGLLQKQVKIVVKKYQIMTSNEEKIFKSEVELLNNARHKNVVMLLGLCTNKSQLMVVYEHVCNGSLDQYLTRGSFQSLTWNQRLKVAMGTARALKHLHVNNIIHGNIKPSNILLTHDFEPRLGDFSLGKLKFEPKKSSKDKSVRNSGYTAPECVENGKLSNKTDVYSFGVVLLELITGRRAMDKLPGGKSLVAWARPLLGGKKYTQLVDLKISNSYEEEKLVWLVQVTEQCLRKNPKERYTMNMAVSSLQGITESLECCEIEDSSPEKSYLLHDDPALIKTQGQMKAEPVKQEQEWTDRDQYEEENSLRLIAETDHMLGQRNADQMIQGEEDVQRSPQEEISSVTVISNDMMDQLNSNQQIQVKQYIEGSSHIEETSEKVDEQQKVIKDEKQVQENCDEDLLNVNEAKINLENSKSSVCSICKSRCPNNELQKKYTFEELEASTEGFSIKYSLTEGEYGPAFKGQLENNQEIVIKQHAFTSLQEQKVFMSEFQLLINARHENVIMLLGSCIRLSQLLIVYEKACNGSLDQYLSSASGRSLTWEQRVKVAVGVAKGLKYLHENNIIHGRIKPSNILLDHEFKPMIGDFVLGKEGCKSKNSYKNKSKQTCGYTAPECHESGKVSSKADVYSFGVVLVELITGQMITDKTSGQQCPVECARQLLGGRKYLQLVDSKVSSSYDEQELNSLIHVAQYCLRKNPKERFSMDMVVSALPCVVDCNDINVKEDFSPENSNLSDVKNSKGEEDSLKEEVLGTENSEERENNINCSKYNNETTEVSQECESYTTCGERSKETKETESSSNKVCQKWEGCSSYAGAREFFKKGVQEYTACEEFFGWCDSI